MLNYQRVPIFDKTECYRPIFVIPVKKNYTLMIYNPPVLSNEAGNGNSPVWFNDFPKKSTSTERECSIATFDYRRVIMRNNKKLLGGFNLLNGP